MAKRVAATGVAEVAAIADATVATGVARHLDAEVATLVGQGSELRHALAVATAERDAVAKDAADLATLAHELFRQREWRGYAAVTRDLVNRHMAAPVATPAAAVAAPTTVA